MRVIEIAGDRELVPVQRPALKPERGQALVDVAACGICGSDLHFRNVPELFPPGTVPGHEFSGRVAALGAGVRDLKLGDRVCVLPFAQCGDCAFCLTGNEQVCPHAVANGVGLGTGRPGAYAEQVVVDERMMFLLPDSVDDHAGALVEPLAVAVRAVAKAEVAKHDPVVVLGAGAIGLLTALVLRIQGYERACLYSRNSARGERAAALGLKTISLEELRRLESLDRPACVLDCAGTPASAQLSIEILRPLGRLILVGLSLAPLELAAPPIVIGELQIHGVITYQRSEFQTAIDILAAGSIPVDDVVTEVVPLEAAEEAFRKLSAPGSQHVKTLLVP